MKKYALSEVLVSFESGSRPKGGIKELDSGVPSIGAEHLDSTGSFNFSKLKLVPEDFHSSLKKGIVKQNDVLIVKDGATTGKVSFVNERFPFKEASINEHIFRLEINSDFAFPPYIFRFLHSPRGKQQILRDFRGATVGGISREFANIVKIPLPTINEQKRIAAILDKADAIRRKQEKAIQLADEFLRSVFLDMFGDPFVNSKGWGQAKIKEMGVVKTGNTPSRNMPEYYGNDIEWIKSDNIHTPYHYLTKAEEKLSKEGRKVGRVVPANSTLVTCIAGSFDCIGNAALADRSVSFNQQINSITPSDDIDPYFLYLQILIAKRLIQAASTNSMKGMVSKSRFENIMLIKPPFKLQKKFGNIFKKFITTNDNLIQNLKNSDYLFNSLSQNAFSG